MANFHNPNVFWITGLPGTGKTTLADWLNSYLLKKGAAVVWLDGDVMRAELFQDFGYSVSERHQLAIKYHILTKIVFKQNINVIVSTVSFFHDVQELNRKSFENYHEIFLELDMKILESGPRNEQYVSTNIEESPRKLMERPLNPSLHLFAEVDEEREFWVAKLEKYLETI